MYSDKTIIENSIDLLVKKGVKYIEQNGRRIQSRAGKALQANNVTYVLTDCRNRVHTLRPESTIPYFARELLAYFYGSENIDGEYGLINASKVWGKLCDEKRKVNSNYGYYVFHQSTKEGKSQLQWIREQFKANLDTRKALININGIDHKINTKDFPCTVGILFSIENNELNCNVQSRSTDVVTGLPYDMGFFSVITELMAKLVSEDLNENITPGYVAMHSSFTQIYDKTLDKAKSLLESCEIKEMQYMPVIENGHNVLMDIYNLGKEPPKTDFMKWCIEKAKKIPLEQRKEENEEQLNENIEELITENKKLEKSDKIADELLEPKLDKDIKESCQTL